MSDNFPTNSNLSSIQKPQNLVRRQSRKSVRGPYQIIRFQSVKIPIYAFEHHGKTRYTNAFYLNGCRKKRQFTFLEDAKQEGLLIAQNIIRGMQSQNDLHPAERESAPEKVGGVARYFEDAYRSLERPRSGRQHENSIEDVMMVHQHRGERSDMLAENIGATRQTESQ